MKIINTLLISTKVLCISTLIGFMQSQACLAVEDTAFSRAIRPISNPAFFDLPLPQSYIHPIFLHQNLPSQIETSLGNLNLDGDFQIYALALEWALNEQFSIVASKDGYIDFNPDATLSEESGFADIAAGIKWAFWVDAEQEFAMSAKLMLELPTGNDSVWQGNGSGIAIPSITVLKLYQNWQFAGTLGAMLPFDTDEESSIFYQSWHISCAIKERVFPLIELNHYHVLNPGGGRPLFIDQAGGAVPAIAHFEGGDLVNLGASNASQNRDLVTLAIGARGRLTDAIDCGLAYEFPLTDEAASLMENRITLDLIYRF